MTISEEMWNTLPPKASYIKNMLKYCGYETPEAVSKLAEDGELEKVFEFMKSISSIVEDKKEVFGIFHQDPQKLTMLPGLKVIISYKKLPFMYLQ